MADALAASLPSDFASAAQSVERKHPVRAVTTRTARVGRHAHEVQANGRAIATGAFRLRVDAG